MDDHSNPKTPPPADAQPGATSQPTPEGSPGESEASQHELSDQERLRLFREGMELGNQMYGEALRKLAE